MKLGFIGGGVMAEAIIAGVRRAGLEADVTVGEPVAARRTALESVYGVTAVAENSAAVKDADMIVLAVKPQQIDGVAAQIGGLLAPDQTVLSILAGVKMHTLGTKLNHGRLIRVMPNTPAQVGEGMCAWTASPEVPESVRVFTGQMLDALGVSIYMEDEKYVDMALAVSASGPAFVYVFMESLIDAGVLLGLPRPMAHTLAQQLIIGSGVLARETGKHPAELRNLVTSPGGTTAAGLQALEEAGFRAAVVNAAVAAWERGEELGKGSK
ncbi:MAG: pyrroline-5-carboxylate reductase [Chloroflexi bacterium]|nr:pyrroline-5-carboxylate reductase [Chloroflexota bacterium]